MKNQKKYSSKAIKISKAIHDRLGAEADRLGVSHKAFSEAALMYFVNRQQNPLAMKDGMVYEILQFIDRGFDRLIRIIMRLEKEKIDLQLRYEKYILQEQINTRILAELNLNTLISQGKINAKQLEIIREDNNAYARNRKEEIMEIYNKRIYDQAEK